ncbi:MAG: hypothetical protein SAJ37_04040 [Oscillatoria sp. PMC 1068.18]|nr:hypothetical protein [Oscillatoria sp. PMC 1076.18]MEC4987897.1 hypothetical protein [Oscillatoria sp. PMC 1068.18]
MLASGSGICEGIAIAKQFELTVANNSARMTAELDYLSSTEANWFEHDETANNCNKRRLSR